MDFMREPIPATRRLRVFETLAEAWKLTKGSKWAIWAPMLVLCGAALAFVLLFMGLAYLFSVAATPDATAHLSITGIVLAIVLCLLLAFAYFGLIAGIIKVSIERARGNAVSGGLGLHSFSRAFPLFLTMLVTIIVIEAPILLFFLGAKILGFMQTNPDGISLVQWLPIVIMALYGLIVASLLYLTGLFAVDQTNNPFAALGRSFKATRHHWLRIIGLMIMVNVIMLLCYCPTLLGIYLQNTPLQLIGSIFMLIAVIWLLPFMLLVQATVYHKLVD